MLRTIAISLILLLSVGVMLPFSNSAHGVRQSAQVGMRRHHRYHSRAWWRRYRARLRKKREVAAAALAHRNVSLGQPQVISLSDLSKTSIPALKTILTTPILPSTAATTVVQSSTRTATRPRYATTAAVSTAAVTTITPSTAINSVAASPVVKSLPVVPATTVTASEAKTPVKSTAQKLPGQMNVSIVALSRPNPVFLTAREANKMLGGTSVSELRRIVIDKMIVAGGWVTNDFVREVNGVRVFVVTARTPKNSKEPEKAWTFYFTEADGRIYGLTTDAPVDSAERMSTEAERFIGKLVANSPTDER
jgi:hypothetical protein